MLPAAPRPAEPSPRSRWSRGGVLAALLFVPNVLLIVGYSSTESLKELIKDGVQANGSITGKRIERRGRGGRAYIVEYRFQPHRGSEIRGRDEVPSETYAKLEVEGGCFVTYLPDRPETHCLGAPEPILRRGSEYALTMAGVAAAVFAVWLGALEIGLRRQLALARNGEPVVGTVSDRGSKKTKNGQIYWVRYTFRSPDGGDRTGWNNVSSAIYDYLHRGSAVTVLVDPDAPGRHRPLYAFREVRFLQAELA